MSDKTKPNGYWTRDRCLSEIKRLHSEGVRLTASNINKNYGSLYNKSLEKLGSWKLAITEAGLDYETILIKRENGYWTKEKIDSEIKRLESEITDMSASNMLKVDSRLFHKAVSHYGSWKSAIEENGIDYSGVLRKRANGYWSEPVIKECIEREIILKNDLTASAIIARNNSLYKASIRAFGSWQDALESSGLEYRDIYVGPGERLEMGKEFERVAFDVLDKCGVIYQKHLKRSDGLIPDLTLRNNVIFDIKLSRYTDFNGDKTLNKYGKGAKLIGIIFLGGHYSNIEFKHNGVIFRHISYYTKQLRKSDRILYDGLFKSLEDRYKNLLEGE